MSGRWLAMLLFSLVVAGRVEAGSGTWTSSGPEGGGVRTLAQDPVAASTFYAGSNNGISKSTDGGTTWALAHAARTSIEFLGTVFEMQFAPDGTLWARAACCIADSLFKSTDSAATWTELNVGVGLPVDFAIDPVASATIYLATRRSGVFKSTDTGASWTAINTGLPSPGSSRSDQTLVIDPSSPTTVYLSSGRDGIYKSTNGGTSWTAINNGFVAGTPPDEFMPRPATLTIDPGTTTTLYTGTNAGVYKTTDGGANWAAANTGIPADTSISWIAIDPTTPASLYATGGGTVYKSADGGASWSDLVTTAGRVLVDRSTSSHLLATGFGVYESDDAGATWQENTTGLRGFFTRDMLVDPSASSTLYAPGSRVFKSTDGGASWSSASSGLSFGLFELAIAPSVTTTLYGTTSSEVYRSTDGGTSWSARIADATPFDDNSSFGPIAVHPTDPDVLVLGARYFHLFDPASAAPVIFRSTDGGANWTGVYTPPATELTSSFATYRPYSIATDPAAVDHFLAASQVSTSPEQRIDVVRSLDGGATWTDVLDGSGTYRPEIVFTPTAPANIYFGGSTATTPNKLYKSTNSGASFAPYNPGVECATDVAVDPGSATVLYTICTHLEVSLDGGMTWGTLTDDTIPTLWNLSVAPTVPRTIHLGTAGGVYSNTLKLADLVVTKSDGATEALPGDPVSYTIEVSNPIGPDEIIGLSVSDSFPAELTSCSWSCVGTGGGVCTAGPTLGDLADLATLPVGAEVTYTATCTLGAGATGTLSNTAMAAMPVGAIDPILDGNSASDSTLVLEVGGCGSFEERDLSAEIVSDTRTITACKTIRAGLGYEVAASGDLTLRAGQSIAFDNGVAIEGTLTLEIDPLLDV